MNLSLAIGTAGLALSDISLRVYSLASDYPAVPIVVLIDPAEFNITLTEISGSGIYTLSNLPDSANVYYTVTYEYPAGVGSSEVYIGDGGGSINVNSVNLLESAAPPAIIIPLRVAGLSLSDLGLLLIENGVLSPSTSDLSVLEIGGLSTPSLVLSVPGDYAVYGWPVPAILGDRWMLVWQPLSAGVYFDRKWLGISGVGSGESKYLSLIAVQPPFDIGLDKQNRPSFAFNVSGFVSTSLSDCTRDIAALIVIAGLGTLGIDLFTGVLPNVPEGDGPIVFIRNTGGSGQRLTQGSSVYENVSCQIAVRAALESDSYNRAADIYRAISPRFNFTVVPV